MRVLNCILLDTFFESFDPILSFRRLAAAPSRLTFSAGAMTASRPLHLHLAPRLALLIA